MKYDVLADQDILTQIEISQFTHSSQVVRSSSARDLLIQSRCHFYHMMNLHRLSIDVHPRRSDIQFNAHAPSPPLNYSEFLIIMAILCNVEIESRSLRTGRSIRSMFVSYRRLVRCALESPNLEYHIICNTLGLTYFNVTQHLLSALSETFHLPHNWRYEIVLSTFQSNSVFLTNILDELTQELASQIDNGGWYAREILRYRELVCGLECTSFDQLLNFVIAAHRSASAVPIEKRLRMIAEARLPFSKLYSVRFVFSKSENIRIIATEMPELPRALPNFPVFNMFQGDSEPGDAQSPARRFKPMPW
jgi:hypothetical protein